MEHVQPCGETIFELLVFWATLVSIAYFILFIYIEIVSHRNFPQDLCLNLHLKTINIRDACLYQFVYTHIQEQNAAKFVLQLLFLYFAE